MDLEKLEALAKVAKDANPYWDDEGMWASDLGSPIEGNYIAAASPSAILAMIAEVRALRAYRNMASRQVFELMGVVIDIEQFGSGFDDACMNTIKRVMRELATKEPK